MAQPYPPRCIGRANGPGFGKTYGLRDRRSALAGVGGQPLGRRKGAGVDTNETPPGSEGTNRLIQDGARLFYRKPEANTWGILNAREEFLKDHPDVVRRVLAAYEEARKYSLANYPELKKTFIAVTNLQDAVVDKQLKERTGLTFNRVGPAQRDSILEAGLALQKGGVIKPDVDIKKAVDELIDDRLVAALTN